MDNRKHSRVYLSTCILRLFIRNPVLCTEQFMCCLTFRKETAVNGHDLLYSNSIDSTKLNVVDYVNRIRIKIVSKNCLTYLRTHLSNWHAHGSQLLVKVKTNSIVDFNYFIFKTKLMCFEYRSNCQQSHSLSRSV